MKHWTKLIAAVAAVVMAMALCVPALAFAESGGVGGTGSITVKNATWNQEYKAYKIFDASFDGDAISYKVKADLKDKVDTDYFTVSTAPEVIGGVTYYTVYAKVDADGNQVKTDAEIIAWLKQHYTDFDSTGVAGTWDAKDSTVTFSDIPYGYYFITSSLGTAVTINSANPEQDVYDKNEVTPTDPVKKIISVDGVETGEVTEANAHVGSIVGFKITAKAANWTGSEDEAVITEQWQVVDTPTNMTIINTTANPIVVKFNGEALDASAYTAVIGDDGKLTVTVPMVNEDGNSIYPATQANEGLIPVEVTYFATIDATAGTAPAKNAIPESDIKVYTYAFQVAKTDGEEPLPGAEFELWYNDAALTFIDNGDGTYTYSADGTVTTLSMLTNTTISIKGLDNTWNYTLKEITVPKGYNQAADITVAGSSLTKVTEGLDTSITSTKLYKETVENKKGVALPSTGGMGTTILYIVGGIMIVVAAVYLVSRRRASKTDKSDDLM